MKVSNSPAEVTFLRLGKKGAGQRKIAKNSTTGGVEVPKILFSVKKKGVMKKKKRGLL